MGSAWLFRLQLGRVVVKRLVMGSGRKLTGDGLGQAGEDGGAGQKWGLPESSVDSFGTGFTFSSAQPLNPS